MMMQFYGKNISNIYFAWFLEFLPRLAGAGAMMVTVVATATVAAAVAAYKSAFSVHKYICHLMTHFGCKYDGKC